MQKKLNNLPEFCFSITLNEMTEFIEYGYVREFNINLHAFLTQKKMNIRRMEDTQEIKNNKCRKCIKNSSVICFDTFAVESTKRTNRFAEILSAHRTHPKLIAEQQTTDVYMNFFCTCDSCRHGNIALVNIRTVSNRIFNRSNPNKAE